MTEQQAARKLAYSVREVAELTPYGYERLLAFINAGALPAKRAEGEKGQPGKFVVLHRDLEKFLDSLPAA